MSRIFKFTLGLIALSASSTSAHAFNFGFVRVPDWMDVFVFSAFALTAVSWVGLGITKPQGVPFNQLSKVKISSIANLFRLSMVITFGLGMLLVFVGMGLQRFAEAG